MMAEPVDYAKALAEAGFRGPAIALGVTRVETWRTHGVYRGFGTVVSSLRQRGYAPALREHDVEPVVRRVEALEAAVEVAERGAAAALRTAAARAEEAERGSAARREVREKSSALIELLKNMTDQELDGGAMRPEIAEEWGRLFPDSPARVTGG